ncbi:MAG: TIGR00270 family protein [Candidatus Lokiarchaeota archaeon]|nr:TIGR00270 family protein [Candidatus Lokiarchaeota archaeon]
MVNTCDICGIEIHGKPRLKYVEGAKLQVCQNCSKFGKSVGFKGTGDDSSPKFIKTQPRMKTRVIKKEQELELIEDYNLRIKNAREKEKLTQDELAQKIKEPVSFVKRVEQGKVHPPISIVKKIERVLRINLLERLEMDDYIPSNVITKDDKMTLGDMIVVKKKKKKDE